jgi:hypothetical protein
VAQKEKKICFYVFFPSVLFSALSSRQNVERSITKIKEGGELKSEKKSRTSAFNLFWQ